jgi:hypothetical protein
VDGAGVYQAVQFARLFVRGARRLAPDVLKVMRADSGRPSPTPS